jgi:threonine dehydratase
VAEGTGTTALAVAIQHRDELAGKNVGLILRGGNITVDQLIQIIRGEMP